MRGTTNDINNLIKHLNWRELTMTSEELNLYRERFLKEHELPSTYLTITDKLIINASDTSNRKAWGGISWFNYWRAMTQNHDEMQQCSFCGKEIFADITSFVCKHHFLSRHKLGMKESIDDYEAFGGHVFKNFENTKDGYWILPLCRDCNNKQGAICKSGVTFCEEIGAIVGS